MSFNTYANPNRNFGRSLAFSEFLNRQTPEQKRKIVAAEKAYLYAVGHPAGRQAAAATAYAEIFKGPTSQPLDTSAAPLDPVGATC
jgi:hypothetical protein